MNHQADLLLSMREQYCPWLSAVLVAGVRSLFVHDSATSGIRGNDTHPKLFFCQQPSCIACWHAFILGARSETQLLQNIATMTNVDQK